MTSGMLWYDNDSKTSLSKKVQQAADYYFKKYGTQPNLCLVHPSMNSEPWAKGGFNIGTINVRPYRPVLPGYIWIGIEDI